MFKVTCGISQIRSSSVWMKTITEKRISFNFFDGPRKRQCDGLKQRTAYSYPRCFVFFSERFLAAPRVIQGWKSLPVDYLLNEIEYFYRQGLSSELPAMSFTPILKSVNKFQVRIGCNGEKLIVFYARATAYFHSLVRQQRLVYKLYAKALVHCHQFWNSNCSQLSLNAFQYKWDTFLNHLKLTHPHY